MISRPKTATRCALAQISRTIAVTVTVLGQSKKDFTDLVDIIGLMPQVLDVR